MSKLKIAAIPTLLFLASTTAANACDCHQANLTFGAAVAAKAAVHPTSNTRIEIGSPIVVKPVQAPKQSSDGKKEWQFSYRVTRAW